MESGSNKSLYTLIAVVVFGIFLSLSYFLFQDNLKGVLANVMSKSSLATNIKIDALFQEKQFYFKASDFNNTTKLFSDPTTLSYGFDGSINSGFDGQGLVFDGLDDKVVYGSEPKIVDSLTLEVWFKSDITQNKALIGKRNSYGLVLLNGKLKTVIWNYDWTPTITINNNELIHAVFTYDYKENKRCLYINGGLVATTNASLPIPQSVDPISLGGWFGTSYESYLDGTLYSASVYNRSLTADEVNQSYIKGF